MPNSTSFDQAFIGGQLLTTTGNQLFLNGLLVGSGNFDAQGVAAATGQVLLSYIAGLSGVFNASSVLTTSLTQTGAILSAQIVALSGVAALTGQNLYIDITGFSGAFNTAIAALTANLTASGVALDVLANSLTIGLASTGNQAWNAANNNGINTSGALTASGQALYLDILGSSGAAMLAVTNTGITITNQMAALSGFVTGMSGYLGTHSSQGALMLNVMQFGAVGNGTTNDYIALQAAINFYTNSGTGYSALYFPPLNFAKTGVLIITGSNLNFVGYGQANILANNDSDYLSVLFNGGSNVVWDGINVNGGRSASTLTPGAGTVGVTNTANLTFKNSRISHTIGYGLCLYGSNYGTVVDSNSFLDFQVGIYAISAFEFGAAGTGQPQKIRITNNKFNDSWGAGQSQNFFGGVKFQALTNGSGYSHGNNISDNIMVNTNQMGIELWGNISDTSVCRNYVENTSFGISIANFSRNITVSENRIWGAGFIGIECADSFNVTVTNNTVEGSTGNSIGVTSLGISLDGTNTSPVGSGNFYNVVGNIVSNCNGYNIHTINCLNLNVVGNTITSNTSSQPVGFYNQNSSYVNFSNNSVNNIKPAQTFVWLDASTTTNSSGITISDNDFNGSCIQQGILLYSSNTGGNCNVLIENNRTYNVSSVGIVGRYDIVDLVSQGVNKNPAISYILRNNVGNPSGIGHFITDAAAPTPATANITQSNSSFIPLSTGWYRVMSGGYEHVGGILRVSSNPNFPTDANSYTDEELWVDVNGYGLGNGTINWMRHSSYGSPVISSGRIGSDGGSTVMIDLFVAQTGAYPLSVSLYTTRATPLLSNIVQNGTTPSTNVVVSSPIVGINTNQNLSIAGTLTVAGTNIGAALGTSSSFIPAASGWYRLISGSFQYIGGKITIGIGPGNTVDGNTVADEEFSISVPGYGIGNGTINWIRHSVYSNGPIISAVRVGSDGGPTVYCDVLIPAGNTGSSPLFINASGPMMEPLLTSITSGAAKPSNNVVVMLGNNSNGFSTTRDVYASGNLTVGGSTITLAGITTSPGASFGNATLPSNPAGFMVMNITGKNFNVPYYN